MQVQPMVGYRGTTDRPNNDQPCRVQDPIVRTKTQQLTGKWQTQVAIFRFCQVVKQVACWTVLGSGFLCTMYVLRTDDDARLLNEKEKEQK